MVVCLLIIRSDWYGDTMYFVNGGKITKIIHFEQVFPFLKECVNVVFSSMFSTLVLVNISAKMSKSVQCHKVRYMEVNGQSKYR